MYNHNGAKLDLRSTDPQTLFPSQPIFGEFIYSGIAEAKTDRIVINEVTEAGVLTHYISAKPFGELNLCYVKVGRPYVRTYRVHGLDVDGNLTISYIKDALLKNYPDPVATISPEI